MAILQADKIVKSYKKRVVVDHVSITVRGGEVVGLLGPNGAGKTTSFKIIVGVVKPDRGKVLFDNRDISGMPIYKRASLGIGYLQQEPSVFQGLSVWDNIDAVLEFHERDAGRRRKRIHELLEELQLSHLKDSIARKLSGGERRRLEISRALAVSPSILMLDEPFSGIDPKTIEEMQDLIAELRKKQIGIFITDHNVRDILTITDRSYIIREGSIIREGPPEQLASDELVREVYLGKRFRL